MPDRHIARYRIVEQIGSGGMSVVYKGVDTALEREVAIKVLHPHLASKEESRRRFSREARAVAKLHHPNILEIFDFSGDDTEDSFIVTEYIRGATLRSFAERERFYPPEIAALAVHELAAALEHAHAAGIIHRDLKPENVMIREDGVLKLMDFGIAKVLDRDENMTMTGALVGSPAHMAPEIVEGADAGREADIWSLGTILYWLCCAKLPFLGNNTTQTLKLVLDANYVDPRLENAAVSDELAGITARCLARDPLDRYPSAGELREALAALLEAVGIERPGEEFATFWAEPGAYRERFRKRLVERLLAESGRCVAGPRRNHPRALDCLNRVLALDAENAEAKGLLAGMSRRRQRQRQLAAGAAVVAAVALIAGAIALLRPAAMPPAPETGSPPPGLVAPQTAAGAPAGREAPTATPVVEPVSAAEPARAAEPAKPASSRAPPRTGAADAEPTRRPGATAAKDTPAPTPNPAARGELSVVYSPKHVARIFLDRTLLNPQGAPAFQGPVPVGSHRLRIESEYCLPDERTIEVAEEKPTHVDVRLQRKPATLVVQSALKHVLVMVNGTPRGFSDESEADPISLPIPEDSVRATVVVRLSHDGYATEEQQVEVRAGEQARLAVELRKP